MEIYLAIILSFPNSPICFEYWNSALSDFELGILPKNNKFCGINIERRVFVLFGVMVSDWGRLACFALCYREEGV